MQSSKLVVYGQRASQPTVQQRQFGPVRAPRLRQVRVCAFSEGGDVLKVFKAAGLPEEVVDRAARFHPRLLQFDVKERVQPVLKYLSEELQIDPQSMGKMLLRHPCLFNYTLDHNIMPVTTFLQSDLGMSPDQIRTLVTRWPVIFSYNVRGQLKPQLAYLGSLGVSTDALPSLVLARPLVLGEGIESVITFLKRCGVPRTEVARLLGSYPLDYRLVLRVPLSPDMEVKG